VVPGADLDWSDAGVRAEFEDLLRFWFDRGVDVSASTWRTGSARLRDYLMPARFPPARRTSSGRGRPTFTVVGESLVDIVIGPVGSDLVEVVGGSPMNVAVGLARLGVPVLLITEFAHDEYGERLLAHLLDNDVELAVTPPRAGRTSTATAHLDAAGAASYDFELTWSLPEQLLPETTGLHLGSLGTAMDPGRASVLDLQRQAIDRDVFVSYDPNARPSLAPDPAAAWRSAVAIADGCNLVKLSDEDARFFQPGGAVDAMVATLLAGARTEIVVVSRGGDGATAYAEGVRVDVPAPPTAVIDTVGAGDALMAGLLAVLFGWGLTRDPHAAGPPIRSHSRVPATAERLGTLLEAGMLVAAETVARRGANPPTLDELPQGWPDLS